MGPSRRTPAQLEEPLGSPRIARTRIELKYSKPRPNASWTDVGAPVTKPAREPTALAARLIGGVTKGELLERVGTIPSVRLHAMAPDDFLPAPLHNHLFTRDTSCWVYDGVSMNPMSKRARRRETVHFEAIYYHHPPLRKGRVPPMDRR